METPNSIEKNKKITPCLTYQRKNKKNTPCLPHEVFLDILSRLPAKSLIRCSCVCKDWFNSIHHDLHFLSSHFLRSQKNPRLIFRFLYPMSRRLNAGNHFFYLGNDGFDFVKIATIRSEYERELIGYCNGLVCVYIADYGIIEVCNPTRREILGIYSPIVNIDASYIAHYGFGFDSLTEEYKVVCVVNDFRCLVFTLGTNSWREITSSVPHRTSDKSAIFPHRTSDKSAIFCNEVNSLYWKTTKGDQMISFDLHHEKFQFIQLPAEFISNDLCVRHLEFNGFLCVAQLSTRWGRLGKYISSKVHLHILKDNTEQVWIKETFFVPFSPPYGVHVIGFSGQIILHWLEMEKKRFRFYNLHMEDDKIVERPRILDRTDYYLISHVENFLSLQTFVQKGARGGVLDFYPPLERILPHRRPRTNGVLVFFCLLSQNPEPSPICNQLCLTL